MDAEQKWSNILDLDEELLNGGVILSEWTASLVREADTAYCTGANLAAILAAQAAMECHLRYELAGNRKEGAGGFFDLIGCADLPDTLRIELHQIPKYRNKWVHVNDPEADQDLFGRPGYYQAEVESMAWQAIKSMRQEYPWNSLYRVW